MAGGTALALQIGHRRSIDFDFFTEGDFDTARVVQHLRKIGKFELFDRSEDTLNGTVNDVQVSFFSYRKMGGNTGNLIRKQGKMLGI